jgi:hypothetical protein
MWRGGPLLSLVDALAIARERQDRLRRERVRSWVA